MWNPFKRKETVSETRALIMPKSEKIFSIESAREK